MPSQSKRKGGSSSGAGSGGGALSSKKRKQDAAATGGGGGVLVSTDTSIVHDKSTQDVTDLAVVNITLASPKNLSRSTTLRRTAAHHTQSTNNAATTTGDTTTSTTTTAPASLQQQIEQHSLLRNAALGVHPTTVLTGLYGTRGERIRHTVHQGALHLPRDALEILLLSTTTTETTIATTSTAMSHAVDAAVSDDLTATDIDKAEIATTVSATGTKKPRSVGSAVPHNKNKPYQLPALDCVLRPLVDPQLRSVTVTELSVMPVSDHNSNNHDPNNHEDHRRSSIPNKLAMPGHVATTKVVHRILQRTQQDKVVPVSATGVSTMPPERIRGGGQGDNNFHVDDDHDESNRSDHETASPRGREEELLHLNAQGESVRDVAAAPGRTATTAVARVAQPTPPRSAPTTGLEPATAPSRTPVPSILPTTQDDNTIAAHKDDQTPINVPRREPLPATFSTSPPTFGEDESAFTANRTPVPLMLQASSQDEDTLAAQTSKDDETLAHRPLPAPSSTTPPTVGQDESATTSNRTPVPPLLPTTTQDNNTLAAHKDQDDETLTRESRPEPSGTTQPIFGEDESATSRMPAPSLLPITTQNDSTLNAHLDPDDETLIREPLSAPSSTRPPIDGKDESATTTTRMPVPSLLPTTTQIDSTLAAHLDPDDETLIREPLSAPSSTRPPTDGNDESATTSNRTPLPSLLLVKTEDDKPLAAHKGKDDELPSGEPPPSTSTMRRSTDEEDEFTTTLNRTPLPSLLIVKMQDDKPLAPHKDKDDELPSIEAPPSPSAMRPPSGRADESTTTSNRTPLPSLLPTKQDADALAAHNDKGDEPVSREPLPAEAANREPCTAKQIKQQTTMSSLPFQESSSTAVTRLLAAGTSIDVLLSSHRPLPVVAAATTSEHEVRVPTVRATTTPATQPHTTVTSLMDLQVQGATPDTASAGAVVAVLPHEQLESEQQPKRPLEQASPSDVAAPSLTSMAVAKQPYHAITSTATDATDPAPVATKDAVRDETLSPARPGAAGAPSPTQNENQSNSTTALLGNGGRPNQDPQHALESSSRVDGVGSTFVAGRTARAVVCTKAMMSGAQTGQVNDAPTLSAMSGISNVAIAALSASVTQEDASAPSQPAQATTTPPQPFAPGAVATQDIESLPSASTTASASFIVATAGAGLQTAEGSAKPALARDAIRVVPPSIVPPNASLPADSRKGTGDKMDIDTPPPATGIDESKDGSQVLTTELEAELHGTLQQQSSAQPSLAAPSSKTPRARSEEDTGTSSPSTLTLKENSAVTTRPLETAGASLSKVSPTDASAKGDPVSAQPKRKAQPSVDAKIEAKPVDSQKSKSSALVPATEGGTLKSSKKSSSPAIKPNKDNAKPGKDAADSVSSEPKSEASPDEKKLPKTEVIPLKKRPPPQWEQQMPGPNDEMLVDVAAKIPKPSWYNPKEISPLEKNLLPEWFDQSAPHRTPVSYIHTRESLMDMSEKLGNRFISGTLARRSIPGDVGSILRLHAFMTNYSLINEDCMNDSAPTPIALQDLSRKSIIWNNELRTTLSKSVVDQAQKRRRLQNADCEFVPVIDWDAVAGAVGHSVTPLECEQEFLSSTPLLQDQGNRGEVPTGCSTSASTVSKLEIQRELFEDLIVVTDPEVIAAATDAALNATDDVVQAQRGAWLGLVVSHSVQEARSQEDAVAQCLSEIVDLRMKKLENRMALLDDVEGMLEAERVALELERRDLYTTRCRHWFGGT